jgi:hypothetical protein
MRLLYFKLRLVLTNQMVGDPMSRLLSNGWGANV